MAKLIPLVVVALLVFTESGQTIWSAGVDLVTGRADDSARGRMEEQRLSERLSGIEPLCESDYKPDGFESDRRSGDRPGRRGTERSTATVWIPSPWAAVLLMALCGRYMLRRRGPAVAGSARRSTVKPARYPIVTGAVARDSLP